jgi:hypothetical protein
MPPYVSLVGSINWLVLEYWAIKSPANGFQAPMKDVILSSKFRRLYHHHHVHNLRKPLGTSAASTSLAWNNGCLDHVLHDCLVNCNLHSCNSLRLTAHVTTMYIGIGPRDDTYSLESEVNHTMEMSKCGKDHSTVSVCTLTKTKPTFLASEWFLRKKPPPCGSSGHDVRNPSPTTKLDLCKSPRIGTTF